MPPPRYPLGRRAVARLGYHVGDRRTVARFEDRRMIIPTIRPAHWREVCRWAGGR